MTAPFSPPPAGTYSPSPPVTIVLTIILLVFFFCGFFSFYFCRCIVQNVIYTWHSWHNQEETPADPAASAGALGLDPSITRSFPTFPYASVKEYRREKYGLECAICLVEFADADVLRLLTKCCHVFHQECIDLWLESHKTCPVCRRGLDKVSKTPETKSPASSHGAMQGIQENESRSMSMDDTFSFSIKIDPDYEKEKESTIVEAERVAAPPTPSMAGAAEDQQNKAEMFSRSHSTGHSIVRRREEEDKFTLILPEHVKAKIIRGHNWTKSCTTFGEYRSKKINGTGGFAEPS